MRLRSYVVDAQHAFTAYWWIPWIVFPLALCGAGTYVVMQPVYGAQMAATFTRFYTLLAVPLVAICIVGQLLWNRFSDDTDHLVR